MTTEIEVHADQGGLALHAQMDYARAISVAHMLPDNYRNKPADIMLAMGLGQSMGLSPAESLYRISVVKGKPTASAELIAANVRKAGHRLRVTGDETYATCTIIRADDPDFEFTVTRDMEWAQRMGLAGNDNYKRQAGTMLQWRAITACARLACPEALYGVAYTPDEMGDGPRLTATQERPAERLAEILGSADQDEAIEGAVIYAAGVDPMDADTNGLGPDEQPRDVKGELWARMGGIPKTQAKAFLVSAVGHDLAKATDVTDDEAADVLANFDALLADFMQEEA